MKCICFDIGDKRVGVAVSDPFGEMALPLETYHRKNFNKDLEYLAHLAESRYAEVIVCGLPLNFDGSRSEQTEKTESFIQELKKKTEEARSYMPVYTDDELEELEDEVEEDSYYDDVDYDEYDKYYDED